MVTAWQLSNDCLMTAWRLPDDYLDGINIFALSDQNTPTHSKKNLKAGSRLVGSYFAINYYYVGLKKTHSVELILEFQES